MYRQINSNEFIDKAKRLVCHLFLDNPELLGDDQDIRVLSPDDFYIVWFSKTLQNWKALVSTDIVRGVYVEVTYNGTRQETYLDVYRKDRNVCIPDHIRSSDDEAVVGGRRATLM